MLRSDAAALLDALRGAQAEAAAAGHAEPAWFGADTSLSPDQLWRGVTEAEEVRRCGLWGWPRVRSRGGCGVCSVLRRRTLSRCAACGVVEGGQGRSELGGGCRRPAASSAPPRRATPYCSPHSLLQPQAGHEVAARLAELVRGGPCAFPNSCPAPPPWLPYRRGTRWRSAWLSWRRRRTAWTAASAATWWVGAWLPWCAVVRCAALCCAVLRCAALCCAVLRCAALCMLRCGGGPPGRPPVALPGGWVAAVLRCGVVEGWEAADRLQGLLHACRCWLQQRRGLAVSRTLPPIPPSPRCL